MKSSKTIPKSKKKISRSKLVKKLDLENNVHFLGLVSEIHLEKLYKNAAVYCYPSPEEDYGLGTLEAGGWGVPSVAWNSAGPTVTVRNDVTGFLVEPFNINKYAQAILKLLENPKLRFELGMQSWEQTKNKFSWKKHIDEIEKAILTLV